MQCMIITEIITETMLPPPTLCVFLHLHCLTVIHSALNRKELNTSQGLGFTVFSTVVDKKTLNKMGLAVVSTFATLIPIVLALQPEELKLTSGEGQCVALSDAQQDTHRCVCARSFSMRMSCL